MNNYEADPAEVRPPEILSKALDLILEKYRYVAFILKTLYFRSQGSSYHLKSKPFFRVDTCPLVRGCVHRSSQVDYIYMVKQFKSLRQDLLVQGIRNEISVRLYEEHARVAIQCRDVGELNQCLTQLKELYRTVRSSF